MPNSFSNLLVYINIGALLLAAVYHTILYLHQKDKLLKRYCFYLWACLLYLLYKGFSKNSDEGLIIPGFHIASDDTFLMTTFLAYIIFLAFALQINSSDKLFIKGFVKLAPWVIAAYIVWITVEANTGQTGFWIYPYLFIRIFLLGLGFTALIYSLKQRPSPYYRYLAAGASLIIFFGLISTLVKLVSANSFLGIGAFGWLQFGYFFDVVFFSAAVGYRYKMEAIEREQALKTVLAQQQELQKNELQKIETAFHAREEERLRISRDLHDELGSSLSSIQLFAEVIEKLFDHNPGRARELLADVKLNAQTASENMADLVWALNSSKAFNSSFEERLRNYCLQLLAPKEISCFVDIPEWFNTMVANTQMRRNLMMVTKECLNNVAKYSQASHCEVAALLTDSQLLLRINDDGVGFDKAKVLSGNGLKNMQQRIAHLGGRFMIETGQGRGTTIGIIIPKIKL